jgi:putative hemolysin
MNAVLEPIRLLTGASAAYAVRTASTPDELYGAQRLRYQVFNVELKEGLAASDATGLDVDPFDNVCDHLIVEHLPTATIVGTYRMQSGPSAQSNIGYYSEQEFDFAPFESIRPQLIELGRACVHHDHRNLIVLSLLWKGIARYAINHDARYLCGCSSVTSQDPAMGASVYSELCRRHLVAVPWRTLPLPAFDCPLDNLCEETPKVPKLLRAYLSLGARICGPPALDRQFKTIDFLTLLDIHALPQLFRERLLA